MKTRLFEVPVNCNQPTTIVGTGDHHLGSNGHNSAVRNRLIKRLLRKESVYWVGTGDMVDCDRPSTREMKWKMYADRKDAWTQQDERDFDFLDRKVIPVYEPVKHTCLGLIDGDHYIRFSNGMTSGQYIANKLGVKYLGERMAYVCIAFRKRRNQSILHRILVRHGKGAPSTVGGDANALVRQNAQWEGDLFFGAHSHKLAAFPEPIVGPKESGTGLHQRIRWYIRTGSLLNGFSPTEQLYPEKAEYSPLCVGWGECEYHFGCPNHNSGNLTIVESKGSTTVAG